MKLTKLQVNFTDDHTTFSEHQLFLPHPVDPSLYTLRNLKDEIEKQFALTNLILSVKTFNGAVVSDYIDKISIID